MYGMYQIGRQEGGIRAELPDEIGRRGLIRRGVKAGAAALGKTMLSVDPASFLHSLSCSHERTNKAFRRPQSPRLWKFVRCSGLPC
jgi:hypothetical protein